MTYAHASAGGEELPRVLQGAALARDRSAAFEQLLLRYGDALRRLAAAYERDEDRREDLLQDILFALWKAMPAFRGDSSERTFVYRVAHNRALTHRRREMRSSAVVPLDDRPDLADRRRGAHETLEAAERRERLLAAIRRLAPGHRQVVLLRLEDLSNQEIAEVLGTTDNVVAIRLTRARKALAQLMGGGDLGRTEE